jgi:hypothetical protein
MIEDILVIPNEIFNNIYRKTFVKKTPVMMTHGMTIFTMIALLLMMLPL